MKPLDRIRKTIEAEIAVKQIVGDILVRVNEGIEDKIIMEMVPQYAIQNINNISSNVLSCLESKYETRAEDKSLTIQEPKPIYFDKRMQRNCQFTFLNKANTMTSFHDSTKSTMWKSKFNTEEWSKLSSFKQMESLKQDSSLSNLQINFSSVQPSSQIQNNLRRRKEEEDRRKDKNNSREQTDNSLKAPPSNRQVGAFLQFKKDYTYDYNGGLIPVNRADKSHQTKIDVSYEFTEKSKQKVISNAPRHSKLKSRLKKTELKLQQCPNCFFDNKSPFYKNFQFQRKNIDSKQKQMPDKVYNGELPNYMRILTQQGGIKKRYARYNQKGQMTASSLLKQRLRQNSLHNQSRVRTSVKQNQRPTLTKFNFNNLQPSDSFSETIMRLPGTDRIKIFNQKLRQRVIQPQFRSQTESDLSEIVNMTDSQFMALAGKKDKKRLPEINAKNN